MSNLNRGRLTIDLAGSWQHYARPLAGWVMLGTVTRGALTSALAQDAAGNFAAINNNQLHPLINRKVQACFDGQPKG